MPLILILACQTILVNILKDVCVSCAKEVRLFGH